MQMANLIDQHSPETSTGREGVLICPSLTDLDYTAGKHTCTALPSASQRAVGPARPARPQPLIILACVVLVEKCPPCASGNTITLIYKLP